MLGFKDLMGAVGEFLLRWSALEQSLSEELLAADGARPSEFAKIAGTLDERLSRWRKLYHGQVDEELLDSIIAQTESLRKFRNLVVHGLAGGNSAPGGGGEPHIRCVVGGWQKPTGEIVEIGIERLTDRTNAADACGRAFANPRFFNYEQSSEP